MDLKTFWQLPLDLRHRMFEPGAERTLRPLAQAMRQSVDGCKDLQVSAGFDLDSVPCEPRFG